MVLASRREVFEAPRYEREAVFRLVLVVEIPIVFPAGETIAGMLGLLERKRTEKGISEPDVREPGTVVEVDAQPHVVEGNAEASVGTAHLSAQERRAEAELGQEPREGSVELVAESATASANDLVENLRWLQKDGNPAMDVEVLERDAQKVPFVKRRQTIGGRAPRKGGSNAFQVVSNIHRGAIVADVR